MKQKYKIASVLLAFIAVFQTSASAASKVKTVYTEHNRTAEEIVVMHKELGNSCFDINVQTKYETPPLLTAPYSAGSLDQEDVKNALNALKMTRFLAGVPYENVKFTNELNNIAQHGAVLLAASNQFSHTPGQPSDMSDDFYKTAYQGCSQANINAGRSNISNAIISFVYDNGQNNISRVGHRRWVLKPGGENFGIGFAKGKGNYGGYRINMHVFDGLGPFDCESDSYVAWPAAGDFPIQYFYASEYTETKVYAPWSINLGANYKEPSKKSVKITLKRASDGKVWNFDKNTPDLGKEDMTDEKLHLSVDNAGYGMTKAIVFRPDVKSLGVISHGEKFTVEISGIYDNKGNAAVLEYDVNFFDLKRTEKKIDEYYAAGGIKATLPTFNVTINNVTVDNSNLEYPFIMYNNITYFPMTYYDSRFLGVKTEYNVTDGLNVYFANGANGEYNGITKSASNVAYYMAAKAEGKIAVNGKEINNQTEEYPLLIFRDVTYFPLTWKYAVEEFGWDYSFNFENGLVINSIK